jgi:NAD(P)H-dependent FMN reductase
MNQEYLRPNEYIFPFFIMKTLIIISSTREHSVSAAAANDIARQIQEMGHFVDIIDLRKTPLPLFSEQERSESLFYMMQDLVHNADNIILTTPDFHGSMSGAMKNFLDYFWTEFAGKLFGIVCASHDKGLTAMDHIRTVIRQCYGWALPYGIGLSEEELSDKGTIDNPHIKKRLSMFARDMVTYGLLLSKQRAEDLGNSEPTFMARYRTIQ